MRKADSIGRPEFLALNILLLLVVVPLRLSLFPELLAPLNANHFVVALVGLYSLVAGCIAMPQMILAMAVIVGAFMTLLLSGMTGYPALNSVLMLSIMYFFSGIKAQALNRKLFGGMFQCYAWIYMGLGIVVDLLRSANHPILKYTLLPDRPDSRFGGLTLNPNQAGIWLCATMLMSLIFVKRSLIRTVFLAIGFWLIYLTECRSAFVAFMVGYGIYIWSERDGQGVTSKVLIALSSSFSIFAAVILFEDRIRDKFENAGFSSRLTMWESVFDTLSRAPVSSMFFGFGPGATVVDTRGVMGIGLTSHNSYLQTLSDYGLVVVSLCVFHLGYLMASLVGRERLRFLTIAIPAALIGLVESQLFDGSSYLWVCVLCAYQLLRVRDEGSSMIRTISMAAAPLP